MQVSLCLMLLVSAGLLVRTLRNLEGVNLGFRTSRSSRLRTRAATVLGRPRGIDPLLRWTAREIAYAARSRKRHPDGQPHRLGLEQQHDACRRRPVGQSTRGRNDAMEQRRAELLRHPRRSHSHWPRFHKADGANAPKVAIINETFARTHFDKREPLGHQVSFTSKRDSP